ncbi:MULTISPECIES: FUSC family protein [unclassified Streptomyces]|uniref:FUSC family protein n=1 Tax=unclassified Streptomyces TaxID=2593676 RepID=UPI000DAB70F8|nr:MULTISPECIES: FUSC family protein [unclassified Streptomyces]PZT72557.1 FUSC family protein [Streptomyces sp. AC1-42T]PZT81126.1 FUSC family protein [Streptomyces sp. AC1-42W]
MSWLRALKETARSGLTIERRRLEPLVAVRGAAGLALVIGVSLALFGPVVAAGSAFGAFQAAIATFQRSWRPRPVLALVSGISLGLSTFLGYVTGTHLALFTLLLVVWTFLAGLAWAAGPTGGIIAASNVAIMLVTITLPTSAAQAALHGAMIMFGGVVQAALIVLFPIRRWGAQRDALADALAAEADYARRLRHDPVAHFDPEPLMVARRAAAVTAREARRRPAELHGSRGVAERIRPVLASLADPAMGVPAEGPQRDRVRELLAAAGSLLDAAARAIRKGDPVRLPAPAVAALRTPDTGALLAGPPLRAADRLAALLSDVIEAAEGDGTKEERAGAREAAEAIEDGPLPREHHPRPGLPHLVPVIVRAMRREAHHGSPILRHAVRIAVVAAVGYLVGRLLPLGHGYWVPMAAVMVMRPEFSQTYSRAVARFGGTLVGVFLASAIVQAAHPGTGPLAVLAVICALLMYLLMRTGYAVSQACVGAYVVFLLGMAGDDLSQTVFERVLLTLAGGLLAMISYAVYPAWETPRLRTRLGDWLKADGRYAAAVVEQYGDPAARGHHDVRAALLATREARVAWQEAVATARHEPVRHRGLSHGASDATQHALAQFGRVAMLLEAHLPPGGATPVPGAARLAEALRRATDRGAKAVRERRVPDWTPVREALERWEAECAAREEAGTAVPAPAPLVRNSAGLLLEALEDFSRGLTS